MKLHFLFFLIMSLFVGTLMAANTQNGPPPGPPPNGTHPSGPPPNGQRPPNNGNNSG